MQVKSQRSPMMKRALRFGAQTDFVSWNCNGVSPDMKQDVHPFSDLLTATGPSRLRSARRHSNRDPFW